MRREKLHPDMQEAKAFCVGKIRRRMRMGENYILILSEVKALVWQNENEDEDGKNYIIICGGQSSRLAK